MTYSPNIPQSADIPSQSQSQLLTNFQQLNSIFNLDHFAFDDATAGNRGHHRMNQLNQQASDPVVAITPGAVLYGKQAGGVGNTGPFWRTAGLGAYSIMVCLRGGNFPLSNGTTNITDFAGLPKMAGMALAIDTSTTSRTLFSPFFWDGANVQFPGPAGQLASGSVLIRFQETGSQAQIISTGGITVNVRYFGELT